MANISSISSWLSWSLVWDVISYVVLFFWLSPVSLDTDKSVLFLWPFSGFFLTPPLIAVDLNRLLSEWKRVIRWAFLLIAAGKRQVFGTDPRGDEAQSASCFKVRNFLWTLGIRTNHRHVHNYYHLQLCRKWLTYAMLPQQVYRSTCTGSTFALHWTTTDHTAVHINKYILWCRSYL